MAPRKKTASRQRSSTPRAQKPKIEEPQYPPDYDWSHIELNRGAPARQYLVKSLTPYILDGLREVNKLRPENPVEWLGQFLLEKAGQQESIKNPTDLVDQPVV